MVHLGSVQISEFVRVTARHTARQSGVAGQRKGVAVVAITLRVMITQCNQ